MAHGLIYFVLFASCRATTGGRYLHVNSMFAETAIVPNTSLDFALLFTHVVRSTEVAIREIIFLILKGLSWA